MNQDGFQVFPFVFKNNYQILSDTAVDSSSCNVDTNGYVVKGGGALAVKIDTNTDFTYGGVLERFSIGAKSNDVCFGGIVLEFVPGPAMDPNLAKTVFVLPESIQRIDRSGLMAKAGSVVSLDVIHGRFSGVIEATRYQDGSVLTTDTVTLVMEEI